MRRTLTWGTLIAALLVGCLFVGNVPAAGKKKPKQAEAPATEKVEEKKAAGETSGEPVEAQATKPTEETKDAGQVAGEASGEPVEAQATKPMEETKAAGEVPGETAEAPEFIKFDKVGKMPPVNFPHRLHAKRLGGCKDCHEGQEPLFTQKRSKEGMKMAGMYAGKSCGACHNGKKAFTAKGGCMKCHRK